MAQARAKFDPAKELTWLQQIDTQISTASEVDRSARTKSVQWRNRAEQLRELDGERNGESRLPTSEALLATAKVLEEVADALNPVGSFSWKQEDVVACAERLRSFLTLGMIDDEDVEEVNRLVGTYAVTQKARGASKTYPDRPAKVTVTASDGTVITTQGGQSENASGNVRNTIVKWLQGNNITIDDEQKKAIGTAVRQSIEDKVPTVSILDFATITHKV